MADCFRSRALADLLVFAANFRPARINEILAIRGYKVNSVESMYCAAYVRYKIHLSLDHWKCINASGIRIVVVLEKLKVGEG